MGGESGESKVRTMESVVSPLSMVLVLILSTGMFLLSKLVLDGGRCIVAILTYGCVFGTLFVFPFDLAMESEPLVIQEDVERGELDRCLLDHCNALTGKAYSEQMRKYMLACCKIYISESRNAFALESMEKAVGLHPEAIIVNKFKDESYNRVGYTLVSAFFSKSPPHSCPLREAVLSMAEAALRSIDLERHVGYHPRLGVVDHICFHPLADASLGQAAALAQSVAADIGCKLQVPTFLYGAAHEEGRTLDSIRRELGYFKPNLDGRRWAGSRPEHFTVKPDVGPSHLDPASGTMVVGATCWVGNYNVPIWCTNVEAVRRLARRVSGRGGGLETVQALALAHGEGCVEVACNLLEPGKVSADQIQSEVQRRAAGEGLRVGQGYFTDFSEEKIVETYLKLISKE